jgi:hypothetical protein
MKYIASIIYEILKFFLDLLQSTTYSVISKIHVIRSGYTFKLRNINLLE